LPAWTAVKSLLSYVITFLQNFTICQYVLKQNIKFTKIFKKYESR